MNRFLLLAFISMLSFAQGYAQKKPLDHSVYDGWQRVGEKLVSPDGNWVAYTVDPQEGDGNLYWKGFGTKAVDRSVARGYNVRFEPNGRYLFAKIKPRFADLREAKIKKKKPEDTPKDSFLLVDLTTDSLRKIPLVKSFKYPDSTGGWVAWHLEKTTPIKSKKTVPVQDKRIDSLGRVIDSLQVVIQSLSVQPKKKKQRDEEEGDGDATDDPISGAGTEAGSDLVVMNLRTGTQRTLANVLDYQFSKKGYRLAVECAADAQDSVSQNRVYCLDLISDSLYLVSKGGNDFRQFSFSEDGRDLVFLAERDARPKELQKYYRVWHYRHGMDSASILVDRHTPGMPLGYAPSEHATLSFSASGNRLFLGTAPIQPAKDTSKIEIDLVKLDIWHYQEDYLQTQQLYNLTRDLQRNYLASYDFEQQKLIQLATPSMPIVLLSKDGDGDRFYGLADSGYRLVSQWTGRTDRDIYWIDAQTGERKMITHDASMVINGSNVSPDGNALVWYDLKKRHYQLWDGTRILDISKGVKFPLWDEENDVPDHPNPYGFVGWLEDGTGLVVYDRHDLWRLDTSSKKLPTRLTEWGRETNTRLRLVRTNPVDKPWQQGQELIFRSFNQKSKSEQLLAGVWMGGKLMFHPITAVTPHTFNAIQLSNRSGRLIYTMENYRQAPDLFTRTIGSKVVDEQKLSALNPQQANYNWGTAELYNWTALNGKPASGVLYKPENFDPKKKYPLILYFYETHTDALHQYIPPTPTGSRLNISFFVSRGYVVCSPDIRYATGQPAQGAYDYVVSAAKSLSAKPWIDAKNIGIQGQSWGGIQVAQLVTMTNIFKAAWSGAPVANMTSAYGGIRWESGLNRQFQYEKSQSRIGATLWERPDLYIKNSPLFHVPKIQTPMVIMANDADGAVPWYQGIELFTAMRRLNKPAWLLNYNGEAHNLRERKNQKDISIREQQFFDWLLKGGKPPRWITEGIPAINKGKDWGLELVD
jgi:dipeptidyl aminopeptidase/acylaminoacyl peptidase